ncbi:serine hydrolase domain-containing protein [Pyxidicoccus sp. MSG2]|uniref:serine hydrolase domain-containing protein n=1 Tax=Pyxidicoccus sp. MSG2 TaxID=2996790 RepID=UPI00226F2615|nr:serine hydrolase domain-containing protein [Pyxidicoccus sp. MSG2]MCY1019540.1 serine hydrolase [Pyxidicoccus sp. MSG2]
MGRYRSGRLALGASLWLLLAGCGKDEPEGTRCEQLAPRLQRALEEAATAEDLPGVTVSLRLPECTWRGATGLSQVESATALKAEDRLRAGSITKTFVAVVALQLQSEGKLSLDAPLATWLPDFPRANLITVRQLLNHTAGTANYTQNADFLTEAMGNPGKVWVPEELIAYGAAHSPFFEPGARWEYSNTNYILVGHIIEAVSGTSLAQQLRTRIFEPLNLTSTGLGGGEPLPPLAVGGYTREVEGGAWTNLEGLLHPSAAGAAGALVSSADDLSRFFAGLFSGELLTAAQRAEMSQWVPAHEGTESGYGLGLVQWEDPVTPMQGHNGGIPGFSSLAVWLPRQKASLAVMTNREGAEQPGVTTQKLLKVLTTL